MSAPVFETFGCRLNAYETEAMRGLADDAGVADAVVVNTCAVTAEAVRQARQRIRRLRRDNPGARIVVTGCAAQTEAATFAAMPEVDHVLGNAEKLRPEAWASLASRRVSVGDIMAEARAPAPLIDGLGTRARAYVQVQNGCDHRCTFCIIPYGRGNSRSVRADVVVEQIARLVDRGFNEVVLTGVDMTSWGADLDGAPRLGDLVARVLRAVPGLPRLRISSIDSVEADPRLIETIATEPRLMPHLHLSLQSGDDMILKRMKRRHARGDAIAFCGMIRAARPDIVFGADIIAGFPTETDAMFENSEKARRGMRPDLAARLPLQRPSRHPGGPNAPSGRRPDPGPRRPIARHRRRASREASRGDAGPDRASADGKARHGPDRGLRPDAARDAGPAGRNRLRQDHGPRRVGASGRSRLITSRSAPRWRCR